MSVRAQARLAVLLWYSVKHTKPRQLLARIWLRAKRSFCSCGLEFIFREAREMSLDPMPTPRAARPMSLLPPRQQLVEMDEDGLVLRMLNETRSLQIPMQWHPKDLEYGTRLGLLNLHYMEYLEALDDELFVAVVTDWIQSNAPYRPGYWLDDWNSYALSIRVVVWMQQLADRGERITSSSRDLIHRSVIQQIRFLTHNLELDIRGNHLIKNIKALLWAGAYFDGQEARIWAQRGHELLLEALSEQILADGMHFELSPSYHTQVFSDLLECHVVLDNPTARDTLAGVLEMMAQVLVDMTHPDGHISLFGDGGLHMTYQAHECLAVFGRLLGKSIEPRKMFVMEEAGYFGVREGENLVIADFGPLAPDSLPAHGHGDMFSFEWTVDGLRMITDPGVYEYNAGFWRSFSRSTSAHNSVVLDGADQGEFWASFRLGRRANLVSRSLSRDDDALVLEGTHDGYRSMEGRPLHNRRMRFSPFRIEIEDQVLDGGGQNVTAGFLLHPECKIEWLRPDKAVVHRADTHLVIESSAPLSGVESWWCPDFGVHEKTTRIQTCYGAAPCRGSITMWCRG